MADKRLDELHTSQMTESAVNVELVEGLKKHGMNVLLGILLVLVALRGTIWIGEYRESKLNTAWDEFTNVSTPESLLATADKYSGYGSIPELAWLDVALMHHRSILRGESLEDNFSDELVNDTDGDGEPDAPADPEPVQMSEEERTELLDAMEGLYKRVLDSSSDVSAKTPFRLQALFGLAAVAEMRNQPDVARSHYTEIQTAAGERYAAWRNIAEQRLATIDSLGDLPPLPTREAFTIARTPPEPEAESPENVSPTPELEGPPLFDDTPETGDGESAESTSDDGEPSGESSDPTTAEDPGTAADDG